MPVPMSGAPRVLTFHCAATPEGRSVKAPTIEQWDIEKFGQKSYHRIVELDGHDHRSLPDTTKGAHVGGHNDRNIGVCYVGGCDAQMRGAKDTRTPGQLGTLEKIAREYIARYPGIVLCGHHDWPGVTKACPSFNVKAWLTSIGLGAHFGVPR